MLQFTKTGPYTYKENYTLDEMISYLKNNTPTLGELIAITAMAGLRTIQDENGYYLCDTNPMKMGVLEGLIALKEEPWSFEEAQDKYYSNAPEGMFYGMDRNGNKGCFEDFEQSIGE